MVLSYKVLSFKLSFTLSFTLALTLSLPLQAQPEIQPLQPGRTPYGVVYFLPKTVVRFHLLVEKQTYTPGDFARYAERYLHIAGIQQQEQVSHHFVNCSFTTVGARDTSKCYTVRLKGKTETTEFQLSDDGVLLAVNDEALAQTTHQPFHPSRHPKSTFYPHQLLSAEALAAGSTAKRAELTAQQIQELQERRQQLASGEADDMPQDEQQLQLMLSEIDKQCDLLMTLFTGTIRRDTTETIVTYCPDKEVERDVVFRLSKRLGIVDNDDLSGVPFYLSLKNLHPANYNAPEDKKQEGYFVNVPGMARLTLYQEDQQLASFDIPVAQFGFVELRDGSIFKRYLTHMQLHPATGAVVKMHSDNEE